MLPARNVSKPRSSGVRALLGKSIHDAPAPKLPSPPRLPNIQSRTPAPQPEVLPSSPDTIAIRVEEIRSIARDVAARESEAKRAARLHAVAVPVVRTADESVVVLKQMFPHLVRQSAATIAVRIVFFVGYVALAVASVFLRALRRTPRLALQARDGLRDAWIRTAFREPKKA